MFYIRVTINKETGFTQTSFPYLAMERVVKQYASKDDAIEDAIRLELFMESCDIDGSCEVRPWA